MSRRPPLLTLGEITARLEFAQAIRLRRTSLHMSITMLANEASLSESEIVKLEAGAVNPTDETRAAICRALGLDAGTLAVISQKES